MKRPTTIFLWVLLILGVLFTIGRTTSSREASHHSGSHLRGPQEESTVEDSVVYGFLFHRVARLKQKTEELRMQRRISQKPYFAVQKEASLTDDQALALDAIAESCRQQVMAQDQKAGKIISAFQSNFPGGKVPAAGSPPPPPELKVMWAERNAIILRSRDQLRIALGSEAFSNFDKYVKYRYGTNSPVSLKPANAK
jgi:hypothetical protein